VFLSTRGQALPDFVNHNLYYTLLFFSLFRAFRAFRAFRVFRGQKYSCA